ncbi:E3 ubiquitin/ISG15 ligase TRIM25 isoform X3 [Paramormyrops kingsleyae]|uniref:E3 ubiquitin/ISG15 ligase TRIM25 isoform X3 n=1 Tax=Paramormyrops kingsleyae TaxID=1676925 RepID=UPI000CD643DC|nr:E3 ubiquitin/ISG15 ligase TRIM25-like isoform X3 [Paramormyrops kingsleyae]
MSTKVWTEEQFNCPVCLDLPNDPVTIPCGHSYCMECIKDYWVKDDHIGIYSCPQCRQTFCPKPPLSRNTMLAEAVEQLKRGGLRSRASISKPANTSSSGGAPAPAGSAPTARVLCDVCQGDSQPATKTCLVCLASYCKAHLKPHQQAAALKHHELIAPTGQLRQKICGKHKYLQEFYCRSCRLFICWLCISHDHKEHDTVSTKAARDEKQPELLTSQLENQKKLEQRESELKEMKKVLECLKGSAGRVQQDAPVILSQLQRSVERLQALVGEVMESSGRDKLNEAQEVVDKLEAEISEMKRRDSEMRDLLICEDNIHFLQHNEALCGPLGDSELPKVTAHPDASFELVRRVLLDLQQEVEDMCNQQLSKISMTVKDTTVFTLGDNNVIAAKTSGQRFKFEFFKLFGGLGSKAAEKQGQGPGASPGSSHSETHGPAAGLGTLDVRSRDEPVVNRDTRNTEPAASQQKEPEASSRDEVPCSHAAVEPGSGRTAVQQKGGSAGTQPSVTVIANQVNPSLFLDSLTSDGPGHHVLPVLTEISVQSLQCPEPRTRPEFLQYACKLVFDCNTAHRRLRLSEGNTKATLQPPTQPYPDLRQRFDGWMQVMCRDALTANRCYWEVEWRGRGSSLGVAYAALARKGTDARAGLGYNAVSWSLELSDTCCSAMHNNEKQDIMVSYSPRVGIYLDQNEGKLAFYSVADNMQLLHVFHANFVEPLYPAFGVGSGVGIGLDFALGQFSSTVDSVKICSI